jgi:hypothetical protein
MRTAAALALLLLLALPACGPLTRCDDYVAGMNATLDRCGDPREFDIGFSDGTQGCGYVGGYASDDAMRDIEESCLPWLESVDCAEFDADALPEFCGAGKFTKTVSR